VGAEKAKVFLEIYKNQIVYSAVLHIVLYNCKVIADGEVDLKILAEAVPLCMSSKLQGG